MTELRVTVMLFKRAGRPTAVVYVPAKVTRRAGWAPPTQITASEDNTKLWLWPDWRGGWKLQTARGVRAAGAATMRSAKFVETRSWKTDYRGPLAIHASASKVERAAAPALARICREAFGPDWPMILPRGKVLAVCQLIDCANAAGIAAQVTAQERACGDFTPGRWAWMLDRIERLPEPIAARGALGLWEWDEGGMVMECRR